MDFMQDERLGKDANILPSGNWSDRRGSRCGGLGRTCRKNSDADSSWHAKMRARLRPSVLFMKVISSGLEAGGSDYSSFRETCRVLGEASHLIALKLAPAKREHLVAAVISFAQGVSNYAVDAYRP